MENLKLITENTDYLFLVDTSKNTGDYPYEWDGCQIIAYRKIDDSVGGLALPLLPESPSRDEVIVSEYIDQHSIGWDDQMFEKYGYELGQDAKKYLAGYKAASKKSIKWSDVDLGILWDFCAYNKGTFEEALEALSPSPTPIVFKPEYEYPKTTLNSGDSCNLEKELKIIDGVLQGAYKF